MVKMSKREITEVLEVNQGFEWGDQGKISDFTMDDFRGRTLPHHSSPTNSRYRGYYRIANYRPGSSCRWGCSRWVTGENGKLVYLDDNYDTSG
jgi:hypothetical protein